MIDNTSSSQSSASLGVELRVRGIVQGVGFRPFVYRLASEYSLSGTVANSGDGVVIRLESPGLVLSDFLRALHDNAPPMSRIDSIVQQSYTDVGLTTFSILKSETGPCIGGLTPPDTAICPDCLRELFDPTDRRYLYPFINCTNCGPRFTIISKNPYDRPNTSMHDFTMCGPCQAEYQHQASRRFHAQPNACWDCGPLLSWHDHTGEPITLNNTPTLTVTALKQGKIVAIRSLGGFHLAVDAENEQAVAELRHRKGRRHKPLAVMTANLTTAHRFCHISEQEANLLTSQKRPIVLLRRKKDAGLAANLAPEINELGIMLPYAPLHYLLFAATDAPTALVMTSGNTSGAPICTKNREALEKLCGIADFYLLHNRDILTRTDDSVLRHDTGKPRLLRRSRGYVPQSIALPLDLPKIIACGAELKNTFCLTHGKSAFLSQHIGDLVNPAALDFYTESIEHLKNLLEIEPIVVVCDQHPDYLSSRYAQNLNLPIISVQHHHAHAAAVMAEHGLTRCLAVIMDGSGWGPDHTVWGGEVLLADLESYKRLGHLEVLPLPGGDAAAHEGWRLALAACWLTKGREGKIPTHLQKIPAKHRQVIHDMLEKKINCPLTSSAGRLFDTVAAILGTTLVSEYEGQAAMELESLAWQALADRPFSAWLCDNSILPVTLSPNNQKTTILSTPMLQTMLESLHDLDAARLALEFHLWLCHSVVALIKATAPEGIPIVLAGGCLQNRLLLNGLFFLLQQQNFMVYSGEQAPVNDGGLALGQAVIGGSLYVSGRTYAGN